LSDHGNKSQQYPLINESGPAETWLSWLEKFKWWGNKDCDGNLGKVLSHMVLVEDILKDYFHT